VIFRALVFALPRNMEKPVAINVGGRSFATLPSTLAKIPYFAARSSFLSRGGAEDSDPAFLDLDPDAFAAVLEFCRHGTTVGLTRRKHRDTLRFLGFEWKTLRAPSLANAPNPSAPLVFECAGASLHVAEPNVPLDLPKAPRGVTGIAVHVRPPADPASFRVCISLGSWGTWSFRGDAMRRVAKRPEFHAYKIPFPGLLSAPVPAGSTITFTKKVTVLVQTTESGYPHGEFFIAASCPVDKNMVASLESRPTCESRLTKIGFTCGRRVPNTLALEIDSSRVSCISSAFLQLVAVNAHRRSLYRIDVNIPIPKKSRVGLVFEQPCDVDEAFVELCVQKPDSAV